MHFFKNTKIQFFLPKPYTNNCSQPFAFCFESFWSFTLAFSGINSWGGDLLDLVLFCRNLQQCCTKQTSTRSSPTCNFHSMLFLLPIPYDDSSLSLSLQHTQNDVPPSWEFMDVNNWSESSYHFFLLQRSKWGWTECPPWTSPRVAKCRGICKLFGYCLFATKSMKQS